MSTGPNITDKMWEKGNYIWFSLTRPCGMRRAVAQVHWKVAEARLHRAFVRTLNVVRREHRAFERFQTRERNVQIFSLERSP